ncbi:MAG: histidine--tRNA ligase [Gammaproteobacteria bacterium]|nr:histidine--tRNA ligase [Gammaproteobacteria bacterium]
MAGAYRLVRGMRDILPDVTGRWREVEEVVVDVLDRYGYTEIRLPLIEATELFSRGVGEATDLVEKEMFTFADRRGKSLSLRPEGTAGCARACIENGLLHNQAPKLWYRGSMFRYERPQKGRSREHTQIGAEVFGLPGPDVDAEMLTMLGRIFRELGIADLVTLELNTIGSQDSRLLYRKALVEYLAPYAADLDADSRRRLDTNPLRILDSKVATTRAIVAGAPPMDAYLDRASREHFEGLRRALDAADVGYVVNPFLVRGLDYYTHTVFEWVTEALGAQNAVSSGGRYDGLVERLGGRPTPGLGFGMGLDRVVLLHAEKASVRTDNEQHRHARADVFVAVAGPEHAQYGAGVAEHVRDHTTLRVLQHAVGGLRSQIREADRSGARWAVIVGDDEVAENRVSLKWLRADRPQSTLDLDTLVTELKQDGHPQGPT